MLLVDYINMDEREDLPTHLCYKILKNNHESINKRIKNWFDLFISQTQTQDILAFFQIKFENWVPNAWLRHKSIWGDGHDIFCDSSSEFKLTTKLKCFSFILNIT